MIVVPSWKRYHFSACVYHNFFPHLTFITVDYIFDYLTILVAVGGFAIVSTVQQALKYTFKVVQSHQSV